MYRIYIHLVTGEVIEETVNEDLSEALGRAIGYAQSICFNDMIINSRNITHVEKRKVK